jgi:hypothetical protein
VTEPEDLNCLVCGQPCLPGGSIMFEPGPTVVRVLHVDCDRRTSARTPLSSAHSVIASLLGPLEAVIGRVAELRDVDPGPVLDLLRSAQSAATDAEAILVRSDVDGLATRSWLHDLRGAFNGLVGWATIFVVKGDLATRDRAAEKMRAFEAHVVRLLAYPPH